MKHKVSEFASVHIPPGTYEAVFLGCTEGPQMKHGGTIFWEFGVEIDDEQIVVSGLSSKSFNHDDRCKAHKWAKIIDEKFTDESEEWDDVDVIGTMVKIVCVDHGIGDDVITRIEEIQRCQEEASEQE